MKNTRVIKVSCCGANELLKVEDVVFFLEKNRKVEIGIGVSKERCQYAMDRFNWILKLQKNLSNESGKSRIAFHVNGEWSINIAKTGKLPKELLFILFHNNGIARVQLNVIGSGYSLENLSAEPVAKLITLLKEKKLARFIIPYNQQSMDFIKNLKLYTNDFDILYDASFGLGKQSSQYYSFFSKNFQGYAGGLSPDNIKQELLKIDKAQKSLVDIWVDAEGKLKCDNCNTLDLKKAQKFATNALEMNNGFSNSKTSEK